MKLSDYLTIGSIAATIVIGILSWFVSAYITKKGLQKKRLSYEIKIHPIISKAFFNKTDDLKVYFKNELLPDPTLLSIDIMNTGNVAIERPPIEVEAVGATYVIPGYIEDIPLGYEELWTMERTDAEKCSIRLDHINPGQVVKARFFLDENPKELPLFKCPMKNLEIKKINTEMKELIMEDLTNIAEPNFIKFILTLYKYIRK